MELGDNDWLGETVALPVCVVVEMLVAVDEPVSVWLGVES